MGKSWFKKNTSKNLCVVGKRIEPKDGKKKVGIHIGVCTCVRFLAASQRSYCLRIKPRRRLCASLFPPLSKLRIGRQRLAISIFHPPCQGPSSSAILFHFHQSPGGTRFWFIIIPVELLKTRPNRNKCFAFFLSLIDRIFFFFKTEGCSCVPS